MNDALDRTSRQIRRRLATPLAAGLALTLGLAACGDSEQGDEGAAPTTAARPTTTAAPASTGDVSAFCDAEIAAEAVFTAGGPEGPDPAALQSAFDEVQESAPAEIAEDVGQLITLTQEAFASGDEEGPPPPEIEELDARIDEFVVDNCDFAELEVTGIEYEFQGLSQPVASGPTAITFTNAGGEEHELVLVRINDDVTLPVEELAALPQEEVFSMIEVKGFSMTGPGTSDVTSVDLEPGRYGALCFFPVGSTPEAVAAAAESGQEIDAPRHFTQGMVAEFTVE